MLQFATLCGKALELNQSLITSDQTQYQAEMTSGYKSLLEELKTKYGVTVVSEDDVTATNRDYESAGDMSSRRISL